MERFETVRGACKIFAYNKPQELESIIEKDYSKEDCLAAFGYYDYPMENSKYTARGAEDKIDISEINGSIKKESYNCIPDSCNYKTTITLPGATYTADGSFSLSQNGYILDNNGNLVLQIDEDLYRIPPMYLSD